MKEVRIYLHGMDDIQKLVGVTAQFPEKLDLMPLDDDDTRVSGKSVVGIFSLDYSHPLRLRIHADEERAEEICSLLQEFLIN